MKRSRWKTCIVWMDRNWKNFYWLVWM